MGQLLQIGFLAALIGLAAHAQVVETRPFCALRGGVEYFNGTPAELSPVRLLDPNGKVVSQTHTEGGRFEFCDFGFGAYSVQVGEGCGATLIKGLKVMFDQTQRLRVVFNDCISGGHLFGTGCQLYIRVFDRERRPLPGVRIHLKSGGEITSGRYGRLAIGVRLDSSASISLQKDGYKTHVVEARCSGKNLEMEVQLDEVKPD